ncbi:MAG TPA: outer membrane lipoprotein carrier protein LolA [Stellaceae bacterium]|jgi:outer membrane lipoprotein-sorting protein
MRPSRHFLHTCRALAAMLALAIPLAVAHAAAPAEVELNPQDTLVLQRVAAYLNGIHTMTARFSQIAGNGQRSAGTMYISRPGRMRFEYDPPNPITLIADTFYVYYWDKDLHQVQQVGLKSTPAWFFLRDPINFTADSLVTGFERSDNQIQVSVVERASPDTGSLTMVFTENPLALRQWTVVDQQGKTTTVSLADLQYGVALNPNLFQYYDPQARTLKVN